MKKIVFLLSMSVLVFACNSADKPAKEAEKAEINIENLVEVSIPVHGMTCEGCENAVKKSVGSLEGIADVSASHTDSVAVVKFDKSLASLEAIKGKISEAGYTVAE
jgi:copper chaperone CopZ